MVRGRSELKAVENPITRQVTFGKRKLGLLKKARELSVMCDCDVALIIFSDKGKLFQYAKDSRMEQILENYETYAYANRHLAREDHEEKENSSHQEYLKLLSKFKVVQTTISRLMGQDLELLGVRDLQKFEQQLDTALKRIRVKKNQLMNESLSKLQKKEKALQDKNRTLAKKVKLRQRLRTEPAELEQENLGQASSFPQLPHPHL